MSEARGMRKTRVGVVVSDGPSSRGRRRREGGGLRGRRGLELHGRAGFRAARREEGPRVDPDGLHA